MGLFIGLHFSFVKKQFLGVTGTELFKKPQKKRLTSTLQRCEKKWFTSMQVYHRAAQVSYISLLYTPGAYSTPVARIASCGLCCNRHSNFGSFFSVFPKRRTR